MNYLALCQMVARESGTLSGTVPLAVTGQTGRLEKVVNWTADAWTRIQNSRSSWLWMRDEFEDDLSAGANRYTAASFNLARFAEWVDEEDSLTLYDTSIGVSDEGPLAFMPWSQYRRVYERGSQTQNKPVHFSISPKKELCFGPVPDKTYTVRGEYRKSPQTLAANDDTPEMPERFHELIAWYALLHLAEFDEAPNHISRAARNYKWMMGSLERDQLPEIRMPGALA